MNSIRNNHQTNVYPIKDNPFEWLSIDKNHKLYALKTDANLYLKRLHADGMKMQTRKKYMVSINHLLDISSKTENQNSFNEESVNLLFNTTTLETFSFSSFT